MTYFHDIKITEDGEPRDETPLFQKLAQAEQPLWMFVEGEGFFVTREKDDGTWEWQRPPEGWSPP